MKNDDTILQIISSETKSSIGDMSIVTPNMYKTIFCNYASSHNTKIKDEEEAIDTFLNRELSLLAKLQSQTSKNATMLSENTTKAISAIKDKNESLLAEVLKETEKLRLEIDKLKESLYKDELTNVYTRKWLNEHLLNKESQNFNRSGILALIDLNYFKDINDTYGHVVGDKVLIYIANQLKKTRESVIRYGGDEFIIIFSSSAHLEDAKTQLNDIREDVSHKHLKIKDSSFSISFSVGISVFNEGDALNEIIELADKNMYDDKIHMKKTVPNLS
ncbi:diguanylate cyclase [bacterium]|nr:diguanylate cyclase [bacterium]MBU1990666.1 diguanylate cyclase [bacterium]